jgi:hypothetical protein
MVMPNFLVFGAAKAGTTSLYKYLEQHPDIYMSSFKEPGFFAFEGEKPTFNGPSAQKWFDRWVATDLESYQKYFEGYGGQKAIGEATPFYIYYPKAAVTIQKYLPDVKLIAILRDPVERAFSNYVWAFRDGVESCSNFAEALAAEETRIKENWSIKWHYLQQGFYFQQLQPYYERFEREQIRIYLYEDLTSDAVGLMQDIFRFLGIDDSFIPTFSKKHNRSLIPKNQTWHEFLSKPNPVKSLFKPFLPLNFRQRLRKQATEKNLFKPKLDPEIRQQLLPKYQEDILKLQDLIQRDLTKWLT